MSLCRAFGRNMAHCPGVLLSGCIVSASDALAQALKERLEDIDRVFLLFPTISRIVDTPNGVKLWVRPLAIQRLAYASHVPGTQWAFRPPMPRVISALSYILRVVPLSILALLYRSWPRNQVLVLRSLLHSPSAISHCLSMGHDEMRTIRELGDDADFLREHTAKIWAYFAEKDDWVGKEREEVMSVLGESERVQICTLRMPHAFCLSECFFVACSAHRSRAAQITANQWPHGVRSGT